MECVLAESDEVLSAALPCTSATEPRFVAPSKKVTNSPAGIAPKADVTIAVIVTTWPAKEGDPDVVTTVIVGCRLSTSSVSGAEALPLALFRTPEYVAVIECEPAIA